MHKHMVLKIIEYKDNASYDNGFKCDRSSFGDAWVDHQVYDIQFELCSYILYH